MIQLHNIYHLTADHSRRWLLLFILFVHSVEKLVSNHDIV